MKKRNVVAGKIGEWHERFYIAIGDFYSLSRYGFCPNSKLGGFS